MNRSPLNIEDLLEQMGSKDIPEDTVHRYELRRELLCSRYYGDHCGAKRWNRLLTFTMPLLTGGVLVVVFSFLGVSLKDQSVPLAAKTEPISVAQEENEFVDSREPVLVYDVIKFVPVQTVDYILMH